MNCQEFERSLQRRADREPIGCAEQALWQHALRCASCRELYEGFRLLSRSFAAHPVPPVPRGLAARVCMVAAQSRSHARPHWLVWLAAACIIGAVGLWLRRATPPDGPATNLAERRPIQANSSASDLLFPELTGSGSVDRRDPVALVDAVEPVSQLIRAFGKSLGSPLLPLATSTSEAMSNLFKDLPDPDSYAVPIPVMRDMMDHGSRKKSGEMNQSS